MSTSDSGRPRPIAPSVEALTALAAQGPEAIARTLDPAVLTSVANEFLRATGEAAATLPESPEAIAMTVVAAFPLQDFGIPSVPALPGGLSAGSAQGAAFYFVSEAAAAAGHAGAPAATSAVPVAGAPLPAGASTAAFAPEVAAGLAASPGLFSPAAIRRDFPILDEQVHGRRLIWLDNAATTQKPNAVIDRIADFYRHENSNIHRAAHTLAARATDAYEASRERVRRFLNAPSVQNIVFVRGATEGINMVAQSWGRRYVQAGDEIVITWLEHHSNIVPWQLLCSERGATLRVAPVDADGQILLDEYEKLFGPRTRLAALTHVSNALGTVTPVAAMTGIAHRFGARVLVDGAQAVSHMPVDVQAIGCDYYVFSGHKVFAPTGIGVVFGTSDVLSESPPWQGGGNMIADVTFEKTVYQPPPGRFEAGTGSIADAVGLGAALDYLDKVGMHNIARHEHELLTYATARLRAIPGLRLIGTAAEKAGVLSFVLDGYRSEEIGTALDQAGVAVRSGHHCAQPALRRFGVETTVRPSLALYNSHADVDALCEAVDALARAR